MKLVGFNTTMVGIRYNIIFSIKKTIIFFIAVVIGKSSYTQIYPSIADSLKNVIITAKNDTTIVAAYLTWGEQVYMQNPDTALILFNNTLNFCNKGLEKEKNKAVRDTLLIRKAAALNNIGYIHVQQGNIEKSLEYYHKSLKIREKIGDKHGIAQILNNIGFIYYNQGDIEKALEYYHKSLAVREEIKDKKGVATSLNNIGVIHEDQGDIEKALEYYHRSLAIKEEIKDKKGVANSLNNIGVIYNNQGNIEKALEYYNKSLVIREEIMDKKGIAGSLHNIGGIHDDQASELKSRQDFVGSDTLINKALQYYHKSLTICEEIEDIQGVANSLHSIAGIYFKKANYLKATEFALRAFIVGKELGYPENIEKTSWLLRQIYRKQNNWKKAYEYYELEMEMHDSLVNEKNLKKSVKQAAKYEYDKKHLADSINHARAIDIKNIELAKKQAETKRQRVVIWFVVCGLLLVIGFLFVVYRMFVQKKKANNIITQKNTQLEQANTEISAQRDKIEIQRDEIALQRDTVAQQKDQLAETLDTLRLTQAQLVESEKMASLGNLVAGVAHEINTPVGIGITASSAMVEDTKQFADLYKNGQMTRQQLENFLDNIYKTGNLLLKNLNRTGDLVQSFKQVSVDQLSEQMRSFNLKDYINDLLLSLKPELDKKTVDVEIECDKALEIYSYPGVFAQIITNFVTNSIKHGFRNRTSGTIKISVYNEVNNLLLEFKDDGIGIPEEIQPKIFDPFFTTNKQTGTGLGLHIVYNLVKQKLSGKISCYSRAGEGATFICTIPLA